MRDDINFGPDTGESLELDLTEPVRPVVSVRPEPLPSAPPPLVALGTAPPLTAPPPQQVPQVGRGSGSSLLVGAMLVGAMVAVAVVVGPRLLRPAEVELKLEHWKRETSIDNNDHYGFLLEAPDRVERKVACDRTRSGGVVSWTCQCSEGGKLIRTTPTEKLQPKSDVEIAKRARELCGWPFVADCPKEHWLACMIMDR